MAEVVAMKSNVPLKILRYNAHYKANKQCQDNNNFLKSKCYTEFGVLKYDS